MTQPVIAYGLLRRICGVLAQASNSVRTATIFANGNGRIVHANATDMRCLPKATCAGHASAVVEGRDR